MSANWILGVTRTKRRRIDFPTPTHSDLSMGNEITAFSVGATSVAAVVSGVLVHIVKDWFAARREVERRRRALWIACANEANDAKKLFDGIVWACDRVKNLDALGSSPPPGSVSSSLSRALIDIDLDNIEVYQELIRSEELVSYFGNLAHQALERYAKTPREERRRLLGHLEAELLDEARALTALHRSRLKVLRVLRKYGRHNSDTVITRAEQCREELLRLEDAWHTDYAKRIGRDPSTVAPPAAGIG